MNREDRERMVDRLLHEALAPQDVEPRAGLEQRILAHLRAQPAPRPWWRWMWAPAALAAVVLLVIALRPAPTPEPAQAPLAVRQPVPATAPSQSVPTPPVVAARRRRAPRTPAPRASAVARIEPESPRQPVFAPARLTEAERALVAVLQNNPEEVRIVLERQEQTRLEMAEYMEQELKPQR